jgi:hypothetical protein
MSSTIDSNEPERPYDNLTPADLDLIARRLTSALGITNAQEDALALLAEVRRTRIALALARGQYANLLAACRVTIAAVRNGETDPLHYLRDELASYGQLPTAVKAPAQPFAMPRDLTRRRARVDEPIPYQLTRKGWAAAKGVPAGGDAA